MATEKISFTVNLDSGGQVTANLNQRQLSKLAAARDLCAALAATRVEGAQEALRHLHQLLVAQGDQQKTETLLERNE